MEGLRFNIRVRQAPDSDLNLTQSLSHKLSERAQSRARVRSASGTCSPKDTRGVCRLVEAIPEFGCRLPRPKAGGKSLEAICSVLARWL